MVAVLFVCSGNICRSPTAQGVFRDLVARAGLDDVIRVESCGTHGLHAGEAPDPRAQDAARRRGYRIDDLRARELRRGDFQRFDYMVAMDRGHLQELKRRKPAGAAAPELALLLDYAPRDSVPAGVRDIPDPYYGGRRGFEDVMTLIDAGARGVMTALCRRHGLTAAGPVA